MSLKAKRGISRLANCQHGGIDYAELKALGIEPDSVLDFSVCTNPFMPPPGTREMLGTIAIERYPDSASTEFRQELAKHLDVPIENIFAASGTTELIRLIAMAYFRKGDRVLILEPAYGDYEVACRMAGARVLKYRAGEENNFSPKVRDVVETIRKDRPRGIFICNPNNPTGKYLSRREIEAVLENTGDGLLVLDEAYVDFVTTRWDSNRLAAQDNIVILRSMTKNYGLAGIRLGYCLAHRDMIDSLQRICWPWSVSIIAQKVGAAVLGKGEYLRQSLRQTRQAKEFLTGELHRLGFTVLPSDAHYFLVKVGSARDFRNSLLRRGFLVRDCTSFGMPEYVRIGPRKLPECKRLVAAIDSMLTPGRHDA